LGDIDVATEALPYYAYAAGLLAQADAVFFSGASQWLSLQNSFNQTIFLTLQDCLRRAGDPAAVRTVNRHGELIDFGVTLDQKNAFSTAHPVIADAFRAVNDRRNKLPGSHPYEKRSASRNQYLKAQERNRFVNLLAKAYAQIVELVPSS
jgi:hypothetical protein